MVTAIFAGTFDPITYGHIEVIKTALQIFEEVVIVVGINSDKQPLFDIKERTSLVIETLQVELKNDYSRIKVLNFEGLLIDIAKNIENPVFIRGIRDTVDYAYELKMSDINNKLCSQIKTIFIPINPIYNSISSSVVKQIAKMKGNVNNFVPIIVAEHLFRKYNI